jgi:hypothetical protein
MRRLAFVAICLLASCSRSKPAPQPEQAAAATAPITASDQIGQPGSTNLAPLAGLPHELDDETAHRPAVKVTVEKLFSALDAKGIKLAAQHQVLASAAAASYCQLGVTPDTIGIAVCEYPSHEAALAGRKMMDSRFAKLVPDAVREVNGATLVTVANASQHVAVRDQILTTFRTL